MALDDFIEDDATEKQSFKTRKKLKNIELPEKFWDEIVTTHPYYAVIAADAVDESSTKAILQKIDQAIEDDISGYNIGDGLKEELEKMREEIIEESL